MWLLLGARVTVVIGLVCTRIALAQRGGSIRNLASQGVLTPVAGLIARLPTRGVA